jgi:hypothetical protein
MCDFHFQRQSNLIMSNNCFMLYIFVPELLYVLIEEKFEKYIDTNFILITRTIKYLLFILVYI